MRCDQNFAFDRVSGQIISRRGNTRIAKKGENKSSRVQLLRHLKLDQSLLSDFSLVLDVREFKV